MHVQLFLFFYFQVFIQQSVNLINRYTIYYKKKVYKTCVSVANKVNLQLKASVDLLLGWWSDFSKLNSLFCLKNHPSRHVNSKFQSKRSSLYRVSLIMVNITSHVFIYRPISITECSSAITQNVSFFTLWTVSKDRITYKRQQSLFMSCTCTID